MFDFQFQHDYNITNNVTSNDSSFSSMGEGQFQPMRLLNAFQSGGEMRMELIIMMLLPFLYENLDWETIKRYFDWSAWKQWHEHQRRRWMHNRYITYRFRRSPWGDIFSADDDDTQNSVLQKAIELYLHSKVKLELKSATVDLTSDGASACDDDNDDDFSCSDYDSDDDNDGGSGGFSMAGWLDKHKIMNKPLAGEWQQLGKFGSPPSLVELSITRNEEMTSSGGDSQKSKNVTFYRTFHLISADKNAIDAFIETAYKHYVQELKQQEEKESRYFYEITSLDKSGGGDADSSNRNNVFRRYELSDEKTFESLFFQQKDTLLKLVSNFENKSGKYSIKGYPHKLGVLLHGPPGTGKTSLIKALAQHTGRSIVNVPLAKISTNSQLASIFFDKKYHLQGKDVPARLGFKDVIFVMEDVDAASNVVRRRADADIYGHDYEGNEEEEASLLEQDNVIALPAMKSLWRMLLESSGRNDKCKELVGLLMGKSKRLKEEASKSDILQAMAQRMMILPGLGLIGERASTAAVGQGNNNDSDDEGETNGSKSNGDSINVVSKIGEDALKAATELMNKYDTVDRFLGTHADNIKAILETSGVMELDDTFVDMMLRPQAASGLLLGACVPEAGSVHEVDEGTGAAMRKERQNSDPSVDLTSAMTCWNSTMAETKETTSMCKGVTTEGSIVQQEPQEDTKGLSTAGMGPYAGLQSQGGRSNRMWGMNKRTVDALNLTGILNVLDGVVDTPGRIVIMTTNHPEMLDPALIRPGRIDQTILLGYMCALDVIGMLEHYYPQECAVSLDMKYQRRVEALMKGGHREGIPPLKVTPAQIEQLIAQYTELDEMIEALEAKAACGGKGGRQRKGLF